MDFEIPIFLTLEYPIILHFGWGRTIHGTSVGTSFPYEITHIARAGYHFQWVRCLKRRDRIRHLARPGKFGRSQHLKSSTVDGQSPIDNGDNTQKMYLTYITEIRPISLRWQTFKLVKMFEPSQQLYFRSNVNHLFPTNPTLQVSKQFASFHLDDQLVVTRHDPYRGGIYIYSKGQFWIRRSAFRMFHRLTCSN